MQTIFKAPLNKKKICKYAALLMDDDKRPPRQWTKDCH